MDANPPLKRNELLQKLSDLNIPDHKGKVHFAEVLTALGYHCKGNGVPVPVCDTTKRIQKALSKFPKKTDLDTQDQVDAYTHYLVALLQSRARAFMTRSEGDEGQDDGQAARVQSVVGETEVRWNSGEALSKDEAASEDAPSKGKVRSNQVLPA